MNRLLATTTILSTLFLIHCGSSGHSGGFANGGASAGAGQGSTGDGLGGSFAVGAGSGTGVVIGPDGGSGTLDVIIRDFRVYDANDSSTNPDFENPPYNKDGQGNPASGYTGNWDDTEIVTDTLGSDKKPVYKHASGGTLTTHGKASFDMWYRDVDGTNIRKVYPLPVTQNADGTFGYDSNVSGVPYGNGQSGDGFFPIDDGSPYATAFGNQGSPHNYSFTVELHTTFTYMGGEVFNFRGDDDVFVYVNGKLVINLGGIHGPESKSVAIDDLGLNRGSSYPLDFFSTERHVTGSNIQFTTTLQLESVPTTN